MFALISSPSQYFSFLNLMLLFQDFQARFDGEIFHHILRCCWHIQRAHDTTYNGHGNMYVSLSSTQCHVTNQFADYIIVICLVLPSGIVVFCSCVIHPIFASHLIMPEVVETLRNFRNLQSLLAYHHVLRAATRSSNAPLSLVHQKEENWEAIGEIEDHLAKSIERIKAYLKDSQAEVWNQVFYIITNRKENKEGIILT